MPRLTRTQGLLAVGSGLALVACTLGPTNSDLNTDGAPRVITVTVLSEAAGEAATFCAAPNSGEKLNAYYCPLDSADVADYPSPPITDAVPINWKARVIFNEQLAADQVEDLLECVDVNHNGQCDGADGTDGYVHGSLANTQPVELTCAGEAVPYDGFYQPTGTHLTYPGGPALVIEPIFPEGFVATSTQDCEITVKSGILGKDLNEITARGPYTFGIAALGVVSTTPEDEETMIDPTATLEVAFNAYIDAVSLTGNISLADVTDANAPVDVPLTMELNATGETVLIKPQSGSLAENTPYTLTVTSGVQDIKGGTLTVEPDVEVTFTTGTTSM